jgi:putative flippase GtrA
MMKIKEISLYTVFGGLTTLLSIGSYKLFLVIGFHYVLATTLSTLLAIIFAYFTNRKYVFESHGSIVHESIKFLIGRLGAFLIETLALIIAVSWIGMDEFYSKLIVTILVVIINYIYSKFIVFNKGGSSEE